MPSPAYLEVLNEPLSQILKNLKHLYPLPGDHNPYQKFIDNMDPAVKDEQSLSGLDPLSFIREQALNDLTNAILELDGFLQMTEYELAHQCNFPSKVASKNLTLHDFVLNQLGYRDFKSFNKVLETFSSSLEIDPTAFVQARMALESLQENVPEFCPATIYTLPTRSVVESNGKFRLQEFEQAATHLLAADKTKDMSSFMGMTNILIDLEFSEEIVAELDDIAPKNGLGQGFMLPVEGDIPNSKYARLQTSRLLTPYFGSKAYRYAMDINSMATTGLSAREITAEVIKLGDYVTTSKTKQQVSSEIYSIVEAHIDTLDNGIQEDMDIDHTQDSLLTCLTRIQDVNKESLSLKGRMKSEGFTLTGAAKLALAIHYADFLENPHNYAKSSAEIIQEGARKYVLGNNAGSAHFVEKKALEVFIGNALETHKNLNSNVVSKFKIDLEAHHDAVSKWIGKRNENQALVQAFPKLKNAVNNYTSFLSKRSNATNKKQRNPRRRGPHATRRI